tara:strand:- start:3315 stop:3833 length:519 start_codon:yes stop_codon:yes gene_type:complete
MGLETGTYLDALVPTNPASTDGLAQADDHIRLLKTTLKNTFPNVTGAVTASHTELNALTGFAGSTADLTYAASLRATGVTNTEFTHLDGVTSAIQTQMDTKAPLASPTFTGTIVAPTANLTTANVTTVDLGDWTVTQTGTNLVFSTGGVGKMKLDASGNLTVVGNVTGFGTI